MRLYRDADYYLFFEDFPCMGVRGFVGSNPDGTSTAFINTMYGPNRQQETVRHELRHIALDHLWRDDMELADKEREADGDCECTITFADDFSWVEITK